MSQLSQSERDAFFKRTFGVTGDKPFTERRYTSLASWTLDGRPIHAEYRTAHRSLPGPKRMSPQNSTPTSPGCRPASASWKRSDLLKDSAPVLFLQNGDTPPGRGMGERDAHRDGVPALTLALAGPHT